MEQGPKEVEVVITKKQKVNHDCYTYSLEFTGQKIQFGIGQFFRFHVNIPTYEHPEGEELFKKYTPISPCSQKDRIDILVKIYRKNVLPQFPNGGKFTPYLETLEPGAKLNIQGPFGLFGYKAGGTAIIRDKQYKCKRIFMIAGGSGITPIYQSMMEIANMPDEKVQLIFLFANKTEEDIILRKELEAKSDRIKLHYILDNPPEGFKGYKGYITHEILKEICPLDDPETVYLHCGPPPMTGAIRTLFEQQYPNSTIFKF